MPSQAEVIQALQNASNGQGLDPMVPPPQSPADVYAGASPFANALGLPDALKALKGQMTPEEGQAFALTSAMGLLPGAKAETAATKTLGGIFPKLFGKSAFAELSPLEYVNKFGGPEAFAKRFPHTFSDLQEYLPQKATSVVQPDISDEAINKKLSDNPGASIFDIAGTNVEGPSSQVKYTPGGATVYPSSTFEDIGRTATPLAPLRANILGRSENLVHGTRGSLTDWKTPTGDIATGDALRLPDDELGVHFGNPRAANEFSGTSVNNQDAPRQYPVIVSTNNPLRLPDLGSWQAPKVIRALRKQGFPQEELDGLNGISDVRNYLTNKGYDSIVYNNNVEDIGHDSYIKFQPSPEAPKYVTGVRSPFAAFDPSKIMRPELAAGIGGAAITPQIQEYIKALQNGGQQNQ